MTVGEEILKALQEQTQVMSQLAASFRAVAQAPMTEDEVASLLRVSSKYVMRMRKEGKLRAIEMGPDDSKKAGHVRYMWADVSDFLEQHATIDKPKFRV